jgi:hypothetical protein
LQPLLRKSSSTCFSEILDKAYGLACLENSTDATRKVYAEAAKDAEADTNMALTEMQDAAAAARKLIARMRP